MKEGQGMDNPMSSRTACTPRSASCTVRLEVVGDCWIDVKRSVVWELIKLFQGILRSIICNRRFGA